MLPPPFRYDAVLLGHSHMCSISPFLIVEASLSKSHTNVKFVRLVCLSVFLSVCTFMTRKYTRIVVIYGVPLVVDSSVYGTFGELLCMPTFNKHVVTNNKNKQVLILRKQVYQSLIKIISLALLLLLKHRAPVNMAWNL